MKGSRAAAMLGLVLLVGLVAADALGVPGVYFTKLAPEPSDDIRAGELSVFHFCKPNANVNGFLKFGSMTGDTTDAPVGWWLPKDIEIVRVVATESEIEGVNASDDTVRIFADATLIFEWARDAKVLNTRPNVTVSADSGQSISVEIVPGSSGNASPDNPQVFLWCRFR